ncbi:ATP-binding protein [Pedobacter xixiisoli]|uniref:histidine kinase n=1 Tax=Pedobacter xixiisoli TaxID=1476464 RepID=A0A285ZVU8_9SPHI|nr:ATP-binding protein [Pedobacter xixiisoli]SOD13764.1 PAS domain S-box-containing protein [Pedobacter xixiisoli]
MLDNSSLEQQRLAALKAYQILDTAPEQDYDELTELAAAICGTPIALISLVDEKRQWFKSHTGISVRETERSQSFCAHAIMDPKGLMQVEDANLDERFKANPLVTGSPNIVFYAGMPLVDAEGYALGSLCVIDTQPRKLNDSQQKAMKTLSKQVVDKLRLRRKLIELETAHLDNMRLNQQSQERESHLEQIIAQSPAAIMVFRGEQLVIDAVNPAMLALLDQPASIQGKELLKVIPALEGQPAYDLLRQTYLTGETLHRRNTPVALERNGNMETGYFDFTYTPLIENGVVIGIIDMAVEVTEQVNAQKSIEVSAQQLHQMVMSAPMGMCILRGEELVIEIANAPMLKIWTRTAEQILGKQLTEVFPEVIDQPYPDMLRNVLRTGETLSIPELTADIAETDGTINRIYIDFTYKPLRNSQGNPEAIIATVIDITETVKARKLLEQSKDELQTANAELGTVNEEYMAINEELMAANEQLLNAEEHLQELNERINIAIDAGGLGYTEVDLVTGKMRCNDTFKSFYGRKPNEELTYPQMFEMMVPEHREMVRAKAIKAREERSLYHALYEIKWSDGSSHWINAYGRGRYDKEGNADRMVGMVSEVTEQVKAQQNIERLNKELQTALAQAIHSEERMKLAVTAAQLGTWFIGITSDEFIITPRTKEIYGFHPEQEISLEQTMAQIMDTHRDEVRLAMEDAIKNGASYDIEYPIIRFHDDETRWLRAVGKKYSAIAGTAVEHFSGTIMDITEPKMEDQRKQDFFSIVSHEMRTPITSINGYIQILETKARKTGDQLAAEIAVKARRQVERMTGMVTGFLDMARAGEGKIYLNKKSFDLSDIFELAKKELMTTVATHQVVFHPVGNVQLNGDQEKLEQVLANFINNAVKYSPAGTTISVDCITDNGSAKVSVTDEGMGIPKQDQPHIFDRFYRVLGSHMENITGFGIGLYLCKEIIDRHDGRLGVESVHGKGSTFWFELPLAR